MKLRLKNKRPPPQSVSDSHIQSPEKSPNCFRRILWRILKILSQRRKVKTIPLENSDPPQTSAVSITDPTAAATKNEGSGDAETFIKKNHRAPEALRKWYWMNRTIGEGSFGKVYFAQHKFTRESVAIKVVHKSTLGDEVERVYREIDALKLLDHPNICKLYQIIETESTFFIIMEYCTRELLELIQNKDEGMKVQEVKRIFRQLVLAVNHLHSKGIAHRDLKPENVLLDSQGNVKLIDFNLCAKMTGDSKFKRRQLDTHCGTIEYVAPELLRGDLYDGVSTDSWSLGVILYILLAGNFPFQDPQIKDKILLGKYEEPSTLSKKSIQLIRKLINVDPMSRLTPSQILKDPWLKSECPPPNVTLSNLRKTSKTFPQAGLKFDEEILEFMSSRMWIPVDELKQSLSLLDFSNHDLATYSILSRKKQSLGDWRFTLWKSAWELRQDTTPRQTKR